MNRQTAYNILTKYIKSKNLIKHSLCVEVTMKHFAKLNNEDVEYWGNIGLLHDIDYELYPAEHCKKCHDILTSENVNPQIIRSIQSHGYNICSDQKPQHLMEKILYTIDELTGLIIACALINPQKKLALVSVEKVLKKWNKKDFAAGANRDIIKNGCNMANLSLEYVIENTILALNTISYELEL